MTEVAVDTVIRAAEALRLAGRWDTAVALLKASSTADPAERAAIAVAIAETEVDRFFWLGRPEPDEAIDGADAAITAAPDDSLSWDLDLLRVRRAYQPALRRISVATGPDAAEAQRLDEWAERLRAAAPDLRRTGWAAFWGGVIADNLRVAPEVAEERYAAALTAAEEVGDDLLASYALRHLGDQAHVRNDLPAAQDMWERATRLREQSGFVPGALAQRLLLGELLLTRGDRNGAMALAADVQRAAEAIGVTWLAAAAEALVDRAGPDGRADRRI